MTHRLVSVAKVPRHSPEIPYDVLAQLPVMIPSLADPDRPQYAYRWECICLEGGPWVASNEQAVNGWVEHVNDDADLHQDDEPERDEIVRLAARMGAKIGLSGLEWLRGLAALDAALPAAPPMKACPDCGAPDGDPHGPGCFYATKAEMDADGFPDPGEPSGPYGPDAPRVGE